MPLKKNPLEDARSRLKEKLSSIKEQADYITQFVDDYVDKAAGPAKELLKENDRKKFFNKYSTVSQELEKCLDCLLLVSDSLLALEEEDLLASGGQDESSSVSEMHSGEKEAQINDKSRDRNDASQTEVPPVVDEKPAKNNTKDLSASIPGDEKPKQVENELSLKNHAAAHSSADDSVTRDHQEKEKGERTAVLSKKEEIKYLESHQLEKTAKPIVDEKETALENANSTELPTPKVITQQKDGLKPKTQQELDRIQDINQCQKHKSASESVEQKSKLKGKKKSGNKGSKLSSELTNSSRIGPAENVDKRIANNKGTMAPVDTIVSHRAPHAVPESGEIRKTHLIQPYPFKNGSCFEVVVTEVLSPWELWIEPCGSTELDLLLERMCMHYAKVAKTGYKGGLKTPPRKGIFCCGKLTHDDTWYRVVVTEVYVPQDRSGHHTGSDETMVEVLCVDDGTRERLPLSRLRPLEEQFAQLPSQALCCALSGVQPLTNESSYQGNQCQSIWNKESTQWLKCKVSGQKLLAYPVRTSGPRGLVVVNLYQLPNKTGSMDVYSTSSSTGKSDGRSSSLPGLQFSIAEMMVKAGYAQRIGQSVLQTDSESSSAGSAKSEESLATSCSSISIASSLAEGTVSSAMEKELLNGRKELVSSIQLARGSSPQKDESLPCFNKIVSVSLEENGPVQSENTGTYLREKTDSTSKEKTVSNVLDSLENSCIHKDSLQGEKEINEEIFSLKDDLQSVTDSDSGVATSSANGRTQSPCGEVKNKSVDSAFHPPEVCKMSISFCWGLTCGGLVSRPAGVNRDFTQRGRQRQRRRLRKSSANRYSPEQLEERHFVVSEEVPALPVPDNETCLRMMISHIVNPSKFYVHLVSPEAAQLKNMWNELNKFYDGDLLPDNEDEVSQILTSKFIPKVGDFCCARFSLDQKWYRAQVLTVTTTSHVNESEDQTDGSSEETPKATSVTELEVFYIDFGDTEWVSSSEIRLLLPRFMKLPSQVVKCSLASIVPYVEDVCEKIEPEKNKKATEPETASSVIKTASETTTSSTSSKKRKKKKKKKSANVDGDISATQTSQDSDQSEIENFQRKEITTSDVLQERNSEKVTQEGLPHADNLKKQKSPHSRRYWSPEAVELFRGLTDGDKQLVGYIVDQDPQILHQVFNPVPKGSSVMGINCRRPSLNLSLFDTTGEEDIFINQVLVDTGLASSSSQRSEIVSLCEGSAKVLCLTVNDLQETADSITDTLEPIDHDDQDCPHPSPSAYDKRHNNSSPSYPMSPTSPTLQMMKDWDPMANDYFSARNAYDLNTDDPEIAVQGYKHPGTQVCHFHNTKSGCWRGDDCPNLHIVKEALALRYAVCAYYQGQAQRMIDMKRRQELLQRQNMPSSKESFEPPKDGLLPTPPLPLMSTLLEPPFGKGCSQETAVLGSPLSAVLGFPRDIARYKSGRYSRRS